MITFNIDEVIRLNLIRILKERNLTPTEFAKIVKREQSQISNWLGDPKKTKPKPISKKMIKEICEKAGINPVEFYDFKVVGIAPVQKVTQNNTDFPRWIEDKDKIIEALEKEVKECRYILDYARTHCEKKTCPILQKIA